MYQLDLFSEVAVKKQLRSYQQSAINNCLENINQGKKSIVLVMPTGSGKSFTIASLLYDLSANPLNCLALVPRRKLKRQLRHEFKLNGLSPQMVHTAQFLSDKKLYEENRFRNLKYIVLDECHELAWWEPVEKLRSLNPNAVVIGLTATPDRSSRKQFITDKFETIIYPISFGELVSDQYLCNPRYFSYGNNLDLKNVDVDIEGIMIQEQLDRECEKLHFNESIVKNLKKHNIHQRRCLIFCSSIKQSKQLTQMLNESGISALHVDGKTSEIEQESVIAKVANGEISALCCAKLLIAGFDEPRIDTVVLATATSSRQNLVQMCGRGSRLHPEKNNEFWVFDFGDNFARLGIKGFPFGLKQRFPYKLRDDQRETKEISMKPCPDCGHLNYGFIMVCAECGFIFTPKEKKILDLQDMDVIEVETDLADLYHAKNIRRIMRECFANNELFFYKTAKYLSSKRIGTMANAMPPRAWMGAIFKQRNLINLLELAWYVDYHCYRLRKGELSKDEIKYFSGVPDKQTKREEVNDWIKVLNNLPILEFGNKFIQSRAVKKYLYSTRWQDVLGVLDFDSKENITNAYKKAWERINKQLEQHIEIKDGEFDPDYIADILENSKSPELKDLQNRIAVLEWAYKYVKLIYPD